MKAVIIIPARMKSSRFPGKPLANILGLPMVEHVRRRALFAKGISRVVVATCDEEIYSLVKANNGEAIMTKETHIGCIDRVAEAAEAMDADIIINLQGDEPLIHPEMINSFLKTFKTNPEIRCCSLMSRINDIEDFNNPNVVKVVTDKNGYAIYFSRKSIPSIKNVQNRFDIIFKQTGLYAYKKDFLLRLTKLTPTPLEVIESIDILRALEYGYKVKMIETKGPLIEVDVVEDIKLVEETMERDSLVNRYLKI